MDGEYLLIYLPRKLGLWYAEEAMKLGLNPGEVMYWVMRTFAENRGFKCEHPLAAHVLHEKGNKKLYRCSECGYLFYKVYDKGIDKWIITSRIEEI
jgi:hypothetical protein